MKITLTGSRSAPWAWINDKLSNVALASLDKAMSYEMSSYDNPPYTVHLLKKHEKSGSYFFPIGLVSEAIEILEDLGYETVYVNGQKAPEPQIKNLMWNGPSIMWPHQINAVNEIMKNFRDNGKGIILHIATGSGKSTIILRLIYELKVPTLIVVPNNDLVNQWENNIRTVLGVEPGKIQGTKNQQNDITVATSQTLAKRIDTLDISKFKFLCQDESHHVPAAQCYKIAMKCNAYYRCGVTATPRREDGDDKKIIAGYGKIINPITTRELINTGILAIPRFIWLKCQVPKGIGYKKWEEVYRKGIVTNEERNNLIVKQAKKYELEGKSIFISVERIAHGEILKERLPGSIFITGKESSKTRDSVFSNFRDKTTLIVIATIGKEGLDLPDMDVLINASSGKSWTTYLQRIGRALRATKNKKTATIIDIMDYGHRFLRDHSQRRLEIIKEVFGEKYIFIED